jgi:fructokinase
MSQLPGRLFGAVEGGGTKFVCAIGDEAGRLLVEERFPTAHPSTTLPYLVSWLQGQVRERGPLAAIGVGSFGPVELRRESPQYGSILKTPKPDWSGTDLLGSLSRVFDCPIGFDTDVNGAALAEHRWGGARDVVDLVYVTVGTGIGGGVVVAGRPVHGLLHPEIGHIHPRRHALDMNFQGVCPFHGDCLEGLASGPAIRARSGASLEHLDAAHPQWEIEADYLAQLCAQLTLTLSPGRLLLGGGVMQQTRLLPLIRRRLQHWLAGYVDRPELAAGIDAYVVAPRLGAQAGVMGALALAIDAAARR